MHNFWTIAIVLALGACSDKRTVFGSCQFDARKTFAHVSDVDQAVVLEDNLIESCMLKNAYALDARSNLCIKVPPFDSNGHAIGDKFIMPDEGDVNCYAPLSGHWWLGN